MKSLSRLSTKLTKSLPATRSLSSSHTFPSPNSIEGRNYDHGSIDVHTHCYLPRYMEGEMIGVVSFQKFS